MDAKRSPRVVAALTTIPARVRSIMPTIHSLQAQTRPLDAIYLAVPPCCPKKVKKQYSQLMLAQLRRRGVEIVRIKRDYGPISKILGALVAESDPDALIVTVDDDVVYPATLVEEMLEKQAQHPDSAIGSAGFRIGYFPFLISVKMNESFWAAKTRAFMLSVGRGGLLVDSLCGYAGIMYKRGFFPAFGDLHRLLRYTAHRAVFAHDDLLLSSYLNMQGIPRRIFVLSEVRTQDLSDGLSNNMYVFAHSFLQAVARLDSAGLIRTRLPVSPMRTLTGAVFGALAVLCIVGAGVIGAVAGSGFTSAARRAVITVVGIILLSVFRATPKRAKTELG